MRLFVISAATAAVLTFGATAGASPFSLTASSSVDQDTANTESRGILEIIIDSTINTFDVVFTVGEKHDDGMVLRYYKDKTACSTEEKEETEIEPEEAEEDEASLVGPEPMYFGF